MALFYLKNGGRICVVAVGGGACLLSWNIDGDGKIVLMSMFVCSLGFVRRRERA